MSMIQKMDLVVECLKAKVRNIFKTKEIKREKNEKIDREMERTKKLKS